MDKYKFALLFGNNTDGIIDGEIKYYGDSFNDDLHAYALLETARKLYPDEEIFKMLNEKHLPSTIAYFLTEMGNIVFLNLTHYKKEGLTKYGRSGMFMLPNTITEKQLESLKKFEKEIANFEVMIKTDLKIEDGFLESKTLTGITGSFDDKLVELISKKCNVINGENTK